MSRVLGGYSRNYLCWLHKECGQGALVSLSLTGAIPAAQGRREDRRQVPGTREGLASSRGCLETGLGNLVPVGALLLAFCPFWFFPHCRSREVTPSAVPCSFLLHPVISQVMLDFIELQASVCVTQRGMDRPVPCLGELTFPGGGQQYTCKQIRQPAPWGVTRAMIKTKAGKGPVAGDCFHRVPSVWIRSGLRLGKDVCHREARPPCCCLQGWGTGRPDLPLRPEAGSRGVPPLQARGPGEAGT